MPVKTHTCSNLLEAVASSRVSVRPWRTGDTSKINSLFNDPAIRPDAANHERPRTAEQWEWEFASTRSEQPAYYIAEQAGRIIGLQGYIPIELLHDGRVVRSGKDEDTLVHPDHRGRGVLDALYRRLFDHAAQDSLSALWGFTSTAVRPLLRNGYHSIGTFDAMRARLGFPSEPMIDPAGHGAPDDITIQTLVQPDERCNAFSLAFGQYAGGITLHLSSDYLRWRILDNPYRRHSMAAAYCGEQMVGFAAFKLDDPQKVGYVSELAAIPTGSHQPEAILSALLREGIVLFRKLGLRAAEARFSGPHPYNSRVRGVLSKWGFQSVPTSQAAEFLVRPIKGDSDDWLNMGRWRICELMREY